MWSYPVTLSVRQARPSRRPGARVQTTGQQRLQLRLDDHRALPQAELGQAAAVPAPRRLPTGKEVLRRVGGDLALVVRLTS